MKRWFILVYSSGMFHYPPSLYFNLSKYAHASLFKDVGNVWEALKKIEEYLLSFPLGKIEGKVEQGAFLINPNKITVGKGAIIEAGAYIKGPCIIGEKCEIRHGAYIRGNCILGQECVVGHTTEVKNSIFLDKAKASHFAYVGDSILGNDINLGAGAKLANLRFDAQKIFISTPEGKIDSGLRKMGAIVGDGAELGCNCVVNPGTLFGKKSRCYPCVNAGGVIPENHLVKNENQTLLLPLSSLH